MTKGRVIEVETRKGGIYQGIEQIKRSSKARYIVVSKRNIQNALDGIHGTGIGVMDVKGKIKEGSEERKTMRAETIRRSLYV